MSKEGIPTFVGLLVLALMMYWGSRLFDAKLLVVFTGILVLAALFSIYFFRDPQRMPPQDPMAIVSPCDGKVIGIDRVRENEFVQGEATRIAIDNPICQTGTDEKATLSGNVNGEENGNMLRPMARGPLGLPRMI